MRVRISINIDNVFRFVFHAVNITNMIIMKYRAGLTIRGGGHTNVRRGPFSHTRIPRIFSFGCTFLLPKSSRPFLVVSERQHSVVKMAVDWGPLAAGAPSHGTTGTIDIQALMK